MKESCWADRWENPQVSGQREHPRPPPPRFLSTLQFGFLPPSFPPCSLASSPLPLPHSVPTPSPSSPSLLSNSPPLPPSNPCAPFHQEPSRKTRKNAGRRVNLCLHPRLNNGGMYGGFATVAGTVECNDMGHWRFLPCFRTGVSSPRLMINNSRFGQPNP